MAYITIDPTKVDPKVLQWTKDKCAHQPHFVKVINPKAALGRHGLICSRNSTYLVRNLSLGVTHGQARLLHIGVCKLNICADH